MLVTRRPEMVFGEFVLWAVVILEEPNPDGAEVAMGSPSFDHIIVNGGSPFSITQAI